MPALQVPQAYDPPPVAALRLGKPPVPVPPPGPLAPALGAPAGSAPTPTVPPVAPSPAPAPAPTPEVVKAETPVGETPKAPETAVPPVANPPGTTTIGELGGGNGIITTRAVPGQPSPWGGPTPAVTQITQPPLLNAGKMGSGSAGGDIASRVNPPKPPGVPATPSAPIKPPGVPVGPLAGPPPPDAGITEFGPGNDLRGAQINPLASARLGGIAGQSDQARAAEIAAAQPRPFEGITARESPVVGQLEGQAIRQVGTGGPGAFEGVAAPSSYAPSAEAQRARVLAAQNLESMSGGPNRQALALDALRNFTQATDPEYQARLRQSKDEAASMGRVGSGMAADDIIRLGRTREQELALREAELANTTAGQELEDRATRLAAAQSAGGQFQGEDLGQAGFTQGLRGEARGERGAALGYGNEAAQLGLQRAGALTGLAGDIYGRGQGLREEARGERAAGQAYGQQGFTNARALAGDIGAAESDQFAREAAQRGELRGERRYQGDLAQQAITNRANEAALEASLGNQDYYQNLARANYASGVGSAYDTQGQDAQAAAAEAARALAVQGSLGQPAAGLGPAPAGSAATAAPGTAAFNALPPEQQEAILRSIFGGYSTSGAGGSQGRGDIYGQP